MYPILSLESIPPLEPYLSNRRTHADDYAAQLTFAAVLLERETYYIAMYTPWGQHGEEPPAAHAWAWEPHPATEAGRRALAAARRGDGTAADRAFDLFGLKEGAVAGLVAVLRPRQWALNGYLLAARFGLDLGLSQDALAAVDQADRLSPGNRIALAYRYEASLMASPDAIPEAERRAVERLVDKVFGPRWSSQLMLAREKHEAMVRRHAWRARTATEGERFTRFLKTERQWCEEERERTLGALDERAVPESLRVLLPLARRYGVGDDPCRGLFVGQTPKREQRRMLGEADPHLDDIQRWLDTYDPASMPPEAAAFFWLLEALEEMR